MSKIKDQIRDEVNETIYSFVGRNNDEQLRKDITEAMLGLLTKYPNYRDYIQQVLKEGKHGHNRKA